MTVDLYRFYDNHDRLLYVGISLSAAQRASQHKADKPWWPDVARMDIQHLDCTRQRAEEIERDTIIRERPIHNVVHNPSTPAPKPNGIAWTCVLCRKPIADRQGGIEMPTADLWRAEKEHAEEDATTGFTLGGSVLDLPKLAEWRPIHTACDPSDNFTYWIEVERIRTYEQLAEWSGHLVRKDWVRFTNWPDLIHQARTSR